MAKANLVLSNGVKVQIEGTAEEVAVLLTKCSSSTPPPEPPKKNRKLPKRGSVRSGAPVRKPKAKGPVGLITELAAEDFFKTKRMLPEIQKKLEQGGHIYAQTSLSPAVLALTQQKILRRLREKKGWAYVRGTTAIQ
jgi:hypothetical protein